ncbi:MAG: four helix bundle protein [Candidatus Omnitrophica bacterium]|nr:four helix bundle protein [Candidatus Omnitrophota bacterium]
MNTAVKSFRDLRIWQKSIEYVEKIYRVTEQFPKIEIYGLVSQIRRAAVSIPSNIAEGFRRNHSKEYKQFLGIALGSCGEIETQVEIAYKLKYIPETSRNELLQEIESLCKMTHALMNKLGC